MDEVTKWLLSKLLTEAMYVKYDGLEAMYLTFVIIAVGLYFIDKYASVKVTGECKVVDRVSVPMNNKQWWVEQVVQGR